MQLMYPIEFTRHAQKAMDRLPRDVRALIERKIEGLRTDPFSAARKAAGRASWLSAEGGRLACDLRGR